MTTPFHTPKPLTILTGASRGMGAAMARQCAAAGHRVLGLSRQQQAGLAAEQWAVDLSDAQPVAERLAQWLSQIDPAAHTEVTLINNAGVIAELAPLADVPLADTVRALRVGLEASMLLTTAFLAATRHWPVPRKVLNISSGLGRRAMAGSASYCAAKAGMDHFSRCVALEEATLPNGARIVSLAPGVIDTDMQVQLRGASASQFPDRENFVQLQAQGRLSSPEDAAARVLAWLHRPDFGQQPAADVRD
ncbi:MAG: short-chain dehydrogenase [Burkholderiales bacterium PBB6]|nr:MAG: short-chain dehydrogenase [Burkholderiales bacterium PBB6]